MTTFKDTKFTQNDIDEMSVPTEVDLTAYYKVLEFAVFEILKQSVEAGWTPDELISEIESLFDDEGEEAQAVQDINKAITFNHTVNKTARKLQGSIDFQGLKISIENRKGSVRQGYDVDGNHWSIKMKYPYGYILGTKASDNEHVDVYVGDSRKSDRVYIIHQNDPFTGNYDEDKVMLGFDTASEARESYLEHYDRPGFYGSMTVTSLDKFRTLLKDKYGKKLTLLKQLKEFQEYLSVFKNLKK